VSFLIIDEWLWADLNGENSPRAQGQSLNFIFAVFRKCDRIVIVKGSKFEKKAWSFTKHEDVRRREISKYFTRNFLYNSLKTHYLDSSSLPSVPSNLAGMTNYDDHYLIQACLVIEDAVVVTTDKSLRAALLECGKSCEHRDEFVQNYISRYGQ